MTAPAKSTRYHPLLVAIHWLMALMIIVMLVMGGLVMQHIPNSEPIKIDGLRGHMIFGVGVAFLIVMRLIIRLKTPKPDHAPTGSAALDAIARATHWAFYVLIIGAAASGIAMSVMAGLPDVVFLGSGDPLPESFWDLPPRIGHRVFTWALAALVALHAAAALYHQLVLKDRLLHRMWFGRRDV